MDTIKNVAAYKTAIQNGETRPDYQRVIQKLREIVVQLPRPNFVTAAKVIAHLHKVAENEEHNHMSASNLGIVFGPTLLRPRFVAKNRKTGTRIILCLNCLGDKNSEKD